MRAFFPLLLLSLLILPYRLCGQQTRADLPPRLVVVVTVGGLSAETLEAHWEQLSPDGFARLSANGISCVNSRLDHLWGNGPSGLATLMMGATPALHGITDHEFFSRSTARLVGWVKDSRYATIGAPRANVSYSPAGLPLATLADSWRIAWPQSRIYSLSLSPFAAVLMGGRTPSGALWYDSQAATFVSSTYYGNALPTPLTTLNTKERVESALKGEWRVLKPPSQMRNVLPNTYSDTEWVHRMEKTRTQLLRNGTLPQTSIRGPKSSQITCRPEGDAILKDLALQLVAGEGLGKRVVPDLLLLHFSAIERVEQLYGRESPHAEDALIRLDRLLGDMIRYLERTIGTKDILVVLASSYPSQASMEYLAAQGLPTGQFSMPRALMLLNVYLQGIYKQEALAVGYSGLQIYFDEPKVEKAGLSIERLERQAAHFLEEMSGVREVLCASDFRAGLAAEGSSRRARLARGYNPRTGGNLLVDLLPGWGVESPLTTSAAGSPLSAGARIPLLFYGWRLKPAKVHQRVSPSDLLPTLCNLLHIPILVEGEGEPIPQVLNW